MSFREVQIGPCRLICGDCMEVLPTLDKVDAVCTDPPYGVNAAQNGMRKQKGHKCSTSYTNAFDDSPEYIAAVAVPCVETCIKLASAVAVSPGFKCLNLYPRADHIGGFYYQGQSTVTAWGAAWWQPVLFYGKDPHVGRLQRDMFIGRSNPEMSNCGHPCPKELSSWQLIVERVSHIGWEILDPFMGSGTTGVACIQTERRFIGIEKEEKYFDIACQRIQRAWDLKCSELPFEKEPPARQLSLIE